MFLDTDGFCPYHVFKKFFPCHYFWSFAFLPITVPRPTATVWRPHRHHTVVSHTADKLCPVIIPLTYLHSCTENVVDGGFSGCILRLWCWKSFHPTCLQHCNWQRSLNCEKYPASYLLQGPPCIGSHAVHLPEEGGSQSEFPTQRICDAFV